MSNKINFIELDFSNLVLFLSYRYDKKYINEDNILIPQIFKNKYFKLYNCGEINKDELFYFITPFIDKKNPFRIPFKKIKIDDLLNNINCLKKYISFLKITSINDQQLKYINMNLIENHNSPIYTFINLRELYLTNKNSDKLFPNYKYTYLKFDYISKEGISKLKNLKLLNIESTNPIFNKKCYQLKLLFPHIEIILNGDILI